MQPAMPPGFAPPASPAVAPPPAAQAQRAPASMPPSVPPTAPPAVRPASDDPVEQIRKLAALRDAGVLTPAEFDAKKAELLGRL
jgi:hypothetical protein